MNMNARWRINYRNLRKLPKLAWLAEVDQAHKTVDLWHGSSVECQADWCVEGVWEDDFERGNFHLVENFFGSGVRVEGESLLFSTSVAPVDRVVHVTWKDRCYVSNSLVQLLARTGARLSFQHDYGAETFASRSGIHRYPAAIRVEHTDFREVYQEYHGNLVYEGGSLRRSVRSQPRPFVSFSDYHDMLLRTLEKMRANYSSPRRSHAMADFATTSTGYDSAAVSALAKSIGVRQSFTTAEDARADERHRESGLPVVEALGLEPILLRSNSDEVGPGERYFLAASIDGSEIVYHDLIGYIESRCQSAVVFTGYYGDVVWSRAMPSFRDDIRRKDVSGLGITEVRLAAGFVHVPVPMMYARNIADIVAISNSAEMQPWSVPRDYDRPIPRRIAETAGALREAFGTTKRAQVFYYNRPKNKLLEKEFFAAVGRGLRTTRMRLELFDILRDLDFRLAKWRGSKPALDDRLPNRRSLMFVWAANSLAAEFGALYTSPFDTD
jgi:hypothetical protein